jgi:hypothetical protein
MVAMKAETLTIAGRSYSSRLIIGSGKYASFADTRRALDASGAAMITVAVRRVNITDPAKRPPRSSICRRSRSAEHGGLLDGGRGGPDRGSAQEARAEVTTTRRSSPTTRRRSRRRGSW